MAILAHYTPRNIEVEITGTLHTSHGVLAIVKANGAIFCQITHGGPAYTDTATVRPDYLENVRRVDDLAVLPCAHANTALQGDCIYHPGGEPEYTEYLVCTDCGEELPELDGRDYGDLVEIDELPV
jgi:hypothetical protein